MRSLYIVIILLISSVLFQNCGDVTTTSGCMNSYATNYDPSATLSVPCDCEFNGIFDNCNYTEPSALNIPPVQQETEVWCWLAVGEMVFKYYGLPNVNGFGDYQCGIVAALGYSLNGGCDACVTNCANCIRPAGNPTMFTYMLNTYPKVACRKAYNENKGLTNAYVANYLAESFLVNELDSLRPVIVGINPGAQFVLPGNSQHVALITGYYYNNNELILKVNDPYPYMSKGIDPYVINGAINNGNLSYDIPYANFVNGLKWNTSWFGLEM